MHTATSPGGSSTEPRSKQAGWITGAAGLIGNCLVQSASLRVPHRSVRPLTRADVDLLDFAAVRDLFRRDPPPWVIHCAAMSQSPACQENPRLARKVNIEMTAMLSELCRNIPFVFFSTDLVFDGRQGHYAETDSVNPLSVYAETKVAAEKIVLANPAHTVIRTSLNGGTSRGGDRGFNEQLRNAFARGETLRLFTDEFRCPIPAPATSRATWELLEKAKPGLYHVAGSQRLSRWELGRMIAERWPQLNPHLEAESLSTYHGAPRSPDTSLDCSKAQRQLSFPLPGLGEWLAAHPDEVF